MLESLNTVAWREIPQPKWNAPNEVPEALRFLVRIDSEQDAEKAYGRLLYAFGNNHAGTYYPVALWSIPFVAEALGHERALVRETALEILIDLAGAFEPEHGFEMINISSGKEKPLRSAVRDAIAKIRPMVEARAAEAARDSREHGLALELLSILG